MSVTDSPKRYEDGQPRVDKESKPWVFIIEDDASTFSDNLS